jgi:hypothetical protein
VGNQAKEPQESRLSYEEAKDICLASLVLVKQRRGGEWVPSFIGRSDIYIVNENGGLKQKNRRHGAEFYADGDGAQYCWGSVTSCTTTIIYDVSSMACAS